MNHLKNTVSKQWVETEGFNFLLLRGTSRGMEMQYMVTYAARSANNRKRKLVVGVQYLK